MKALEIRDSFGVNSLKLVERPGTNVGGYGVNQELGDGSRIVDHFAGRLSDLWTEPRIMREAMMAQTLRQ